MAKLYFKFGAMGCSKTAQALITKFNYEERGMKVLLLKPAVDNRDGETITKSRIGLQAQALAVRDDEDLYALYKRAYSACNVVIVDECQFLTPEQVDELGQIVIDFNVPVLCFGLATDFTTHMFPGSKRLFEIAESISEIKSVCKCKSHRQRAYGRSWQHSFQRRTGLSRRKRSLRRYVQKVLAQEKSRAGSQRPVFVRRKT